MKQKPEFSLKRIEPTKYVFSKDIKLGKGAFGEVYLGFDEQDRRPIAVKAISFEKIKKSNDNVQGFFQKLAGEMVNMQICKSQHLVKLISSHKSSRNMYLVCEYCNGRSFKDYLNHYGPLSEFEALHFFKEILKGIKILHQNRVVHRDLKPANILIDDYQLKIGDLGFSKSLQVHEQILTSIVGTPLYMSPQILSQKTYTQKTDVWSLGIILFEMMCGEAPWKVNSIPQILERAKNKPDFHKIPHCSEQIKQLLQKMLEYEQNNRLSVKQLLKFFFDDQRMEDENNESEQRAFEMIRLCKQHFAFSLSLQSEQKIRYILRNNSITPRELVDIQECETARQYISKMSVIQRSEPELEKLFTFFRTARNRNTYLLNILFTNYEILTKSQTPKCIWGQNGIGSICSLIGSTILIIRYCLESTYQMLDALTKQSTFDIYIKEHNLQEKQGFFRASSLASNFKMLIQLDISYIHKLYHSLNEAILISRINSLSPENPHHHEMLKNLQSFFSENLPIYQSHSEMEEQQPNQSPRQNIELLMFWLKNYLNILHNDIKSYIIEKIDSEQKIFLNESITMNDEYHYISNGLILTKLIYEFHRSQNTAIFEYTGVKLNIYRKFEGWASEGSVRNWYKKVKEENGFLAIEHINGFLNKKINNNKLAMYNISFL